jgi:hypothetical protein
MISVSWLFWRDEADSAVIHGVVLVLHFATIKVGLICAVQSQSSSSMEQIQLASQSIYDHQYPRNKVTDH